MKKILVTTDLSNNSKAGLYFAIQLAAQYAFQLTFFYSCHTLAKVSVEYEKATLKKTQDNLERFVEKAYLRMDIIPASKKCIIKSSVMPQQSIMEYAAGHHFDFICMSTRGAGKLKQVFGTNTSNIISYATIPVIAVPYNYKPVLISSILYASDLHDLAPELGKVIAFSKKVKATVALLHLTSPMEKKVDQKTVEPVVKKLSRSNITVNIKNPGFGQNVVAFIESFIKKTKPSVLIMFTDQNRSLFQKLFFSGNAMEYAYHPKIPLLVFHKS